MLNISNNISQYSFKGLKSFREKQALPEIKVMQEEKNGLEIVTKPKTEIVPATKNESKIEVYGKAKPVSKSKKTEAIRRAAVGASVLGASFIILNNIPASKASNDELPEFSPNVVTVSTESQDNVDNNTDNTFSGSESSTSVTDSAAQIKPDAKDSNIIDSSSRVEKKTSSEPEVNIVVKPYPSKENSEVENSEVGTSYLTDNEKLRLDIKLGAGFSWKLEEISKNINCNPKDLLLLMCSESGLNPQAQNSIGATGLIQFLPSSAEALGTSTWELVNMSGVQQLDYVEKHFMLVKNGNTDYADAGTLYAYTFLPAYAGYGYDEPMCYAGSDYYEYNTVLDTNGDGAITKRDLADRLYNTVNLDDWLD